MKNNHKQHSFVIVAYKDSPYLERCIKSIQKQTVISRIIISTSTPSSYIKNIAKIYRLSLVISPGGGIGCDWNNAINACKTRYFTISHQDDEYLPYYTESCLSSIKKDTLIVFTNYIEIDKNGNLIADNINLKIKRFALLFLKIFNNTTNLNFIKKLLLSFGNIIACPSVFYDKKNIGNFLFNENLKFALDWEAWIRLSESRGSFSYVDNVMMYHRIHNESETNMQTLNKNRIIEEYNIFKSLWPDYLAIILLKLYRYNSKIILKQL